VDALLLESDGLAFPVAAACRLLGRKPGSDLLLAGYDNYAIDLEWERQQEPVGPSVTMDKRNSEMGREMVRLLLDRCQGRLPVGPQVRLVAPELIPLDGVSP
jgi:DNA-binding LacI/PurR family transcriptional regulator